MRRDAQLAAQMGRAALLVSIVAGLGAMPSVTAQVGPADESMVRASLLRPEDLPRQTTSTGLDITASSGLPGYVENGGLLEATQDWLGRDAAVTVSDARWLFPDPASAASFLDASEETLGRVPTGGVEQTLLSEPLPDTRSYVESDQILGIGDVALIVLMRHERLVASVSLSGGKDHVSPKEAWHLAEAAAARMVGALAGAPAPSFATGSPDPAAVAELLAHIPLAVRATCGSRNATTELATVDCVPGAGATLRYDLFESQEELNGALAWATSYASAFGTMSTSDSCRDGGYSGPWPERGTQSMGWLLCYQLRGDAVVIWSHDATRILASLNIPGAGHEAAHELWLTAGPE